MRRLAVPGQGALCVGIPGSADSRPCRSGTVIAHGQGMGWGSQAAGGGQGRAVPVERLVGKLMDSGDPRRLSSLSSLWSFYTVTSP